LSSDNEGLPMAILEYGASGLAVIVTEVGDCERVISKLGKLVAPQDAKALSQAIIDYIENEGQRLEDAKQYRNHIKNNFSLEAVFPLLIDIYKN
jgi:glycosyltransferase involved in cell wall biosynthesis